MPKKRLYVPGSDKPFPLSRSKIELFLNCPCCFYLDRRLGVKQPGGLPFTLNAAVDALLKKEFDAYRVRQRAHPLMLQNAVDAVPCDHPDLESWRHNFTGIRHIHEPTNLELYGAVDDVWVGADGRLIVVDYKATSTTTPITLDDEWKTGYKRQMEFYQFLLRQNGFDVNPTGYFLYANGRKSADAFEGTLKFDLHLLPYTGSDKWVGATIGQAKACLESVSPPAPTADCEFCDYREIASRAVQSGP